MELDESHITNHQQALWLCGPSISISESIASGASLLPWIRGSTAVAVLWIMPVLNGDKWHTYMIQMMAKISGLRGLTLTHTPVIFTSDSSRKSVQSSAPKFLRLTAYLANRPTSQQHSLLSQLWHANSRDQNTLFGSRPKLTELRAPTIKSGVLCPSTRNWCRAALRSWRNGAAKESSPHSIELMWFWSFLATWGFLAISHEGSPVFTMGFNTKSWSNDLDHLEYPHDLGNLHFHPFPNFPIPALLVFNWLRIRRISAPHNFNVNVCNLSSRNQKKG